MPYQVFDCADGWIIIATGHDAQCQRLCAVLGLDGLASHPDYRSNADRVRNRRVLAELLTQATRKRSKADLLAACEDQGVPAGPINNMAEVFADPQVIARKLRIDLDGIPSVRSPMLFSDAELSLDRPSPRLGEHNDEVLGRD